MAAALFFFVFPAPVNEIVLYNTSTTTENLKSLFNLMMIHQLAIPRLIHCQINHTLKTSEHICMFSIMFHYMKLVVQRVNKQIFDQFSIRAIRVGLSLIEAAS